MWYYYLIFFIISLFCFIKLPRKVDFLGCLFCGLLLVFTAGLRDENVDKDYVYYKKAFYEGSFFYEPTFSIIRNITRNVTEKPDLLFFIYALLGVSFKLIAIRSISSFFYFSLLIYYSNVFLLHDMTQIRVAVASALFLFSLPYLRNNRLSLYVCLIIIATLFHYSAVVLLILCFLDKDEFNKKTWGLLIPVSYILYFCGTDLFNLIMMVRAEYIQTKVSMYMLNLKNEHINVFNILQIVRILLVYLSIYKIQFLQQKNDYFILILKIYILALVLFVLFYNFPVVAFRISELLLVIECIFIPCLIFLSKPKYIGKYCIVLLSLVILTINLFRVELLNPYF